MDLERISELNFEKITVWQMLVLALPFDPRWNIFIAIQCYVLFILSTGKFAFQLHINMINGVLYVMEVFYFVDVAFLLTYLGQKRLRDLNFNRCRHWIFIFIDLISLIPSELLLTFFYVSEKKNQILIDALSQNGCLRIYRVVQMELTFLQTVRSNISSSLVIIFCLSINAILLGHLYTCIWYNLKKSYDCNPKIFNCILWYEMNMLRVTLLGWTGPEEMFLNKGESILVTFAMLSGFILLYLGIFPLTFYFGLLWSYNDSISYSKQEKLKKFISNMQLKGAVREKVQNYFNYVWGDGDNFEENSSILSNFPLCCRKDICTDIYWEAFRHSYFFCDASRNFKRTASITMYTEYHQDGEVIYFKGQEKKNMIYLAQGVLQIMAEENDESPLLSFSNGTVLGELSLFLFTKSPSIVKCRGFCELQILTQRGALLAMSKYPKDRKQILQKLNRRILMAKQTHWRKEKFVKEELAVISKNLDLIKTEDSVKWLKTQWRSIWERHKRHLDVLKAKEEGSRLTSWRNAKTPDIKINFISNNLDLLVLSDFFQETRDVVCLNKSCPWFINPSAQFFRLWYRFVMVTSVIPVIVYPLCTSWMTTFPNFVFILSNIITMIFILDVAFKLMTAESVRHEFTTHFFGVVLHNLSNFTFYLDVISAFPYQLFVFFKPDFFNLSHGYRVGLLLHPAMLKSYVFFNSNIHFGPFKVFLTCLKIFLSSILTVYWLSEVIQLISVRREFFSDRSVPVKWIERYLSAYENTEIIKKYLISVIKAFIIMVQSPGQVVYPDNDADAIFTIIAKMVFLFSAFISMKLLYSSLIVSCYSLEKFQSRIKLISDYLKEKNLPEKISASIIHGMKFQWDYNNGELLSDDLRILRSMPENLRKDVFAKTILNTLKSTLLFREESTEFLEEVLESSDYIAVPRGLLLVRYGQTSDSMIIIHRGYCQINSNLSQDVTANVGKNFTVGPSTCFPVLSSFSGAPSPVSVVTITECELIMIEINKLLNIMIKFNAFKDLVDVTRTGNYLSRLLDTKPALMRTELKSNYRETGKRNNIFYILSRISLLSNPEFYKWWEVVHVIYVIIVSVIWPCCFGLLANVAHILQPLFLVAKLIVLLNMVIHASMPYYNSKGLSVSHPYKTLLNYLTSTFVVDFFRLLPVYFIYYYGFVDPYKTGNPIVVGLLFLANSLNLIYIQSFIEYATREVLNNCLVWCVKFSVVLLLLINFYTNFWMFCSVKWYFGGPREIVGFEYMTFYDWAPWKKKFGHCYLMILYWIAASLSMHSYVVVYLHHRILYFSYIQNFIAVLTSFFVYSKVCTYGKIKNLGRNTLEDEFQSFIKYLKREEIDPELVEHVKVFYKNWGKKQGFRLKKGLPTYLSEELWYPLYRPTFARNEVFEGSDEGFFRQLANTVSSSFFTRGSVVIFRGEVQSYIYFLHKGTCFVYDWFVMLEVGSIIGDIHQTGLMQNKVYALTHVEMLKISTKAFFSILNSFDTLEENFMWNVKKSENFMKANIHRDYQLRPVDSMDAVQTFNLKYKEIKFEDESRFEDPGDAVIHKFKSNKQKESRKWIIYPRTLAMNTLKELGSLDVILIGFFVPFFFAIGPLSYSAFTIFGVLDFFFLIFVVCSFRMAVEDVRNGDVITNSKYMAKYYLRTAFYYDLISLIPFDLLPVVFYGRRESIATSVRVFRIFKCFRIYSFFKFRKSWITGTSPFAIAAFVFLFSIWWIFLFTSIFLSLVDYFIENSLRIQGDWFDWFSFIFEYVVDITTATKLNVNAPINRPQICHFIFCITMGFLMKVFVMNYVLNMLQLKNLTKFLFRTQVAKLESFLRKKDSSPFIIRASVDYKIKAFSYTRAESGWFMTKIPMNLRIPLMESLYIHLFLSFPLFQDLDRVFIRQLVARANREVFFPGQKIVEQGDIDQRFYFIHKGEVYVLNQTKDRAYLEYVVDKMHEGMYFGECQGLWFLKPHAFTYRGRTVVELITLVLEDWEDLRKTFPEITQKIFEKAKSLKYI